MNEAKVLNTRLYLAFKQYFMYVEMLKFGQKCPTSINSKRRKLGFATVSIFAKVHFRLTMHFLKYCIFDQK